MTFDPYIHHRRSIRLKEYDYSQPGAYFITIVTQNCINLFGELTKDIMHLNASGEIIRTVWLRLPGFFQIRHDEWVIMPNHLHGIIWILDIGTGEASAIEKNKSTFSHTADASPPRQPIGTNHGSLGSIIQNFKSVSTRKINLYFRNLANSEALVIKGITDSQYLVANASSKRIWQRYYFEHVIRNQKELDFIRQYIADNPRKWSEDKEYHAQKRMLHPYGSTALPSWSP